MSEQKKRELLLSLISELYRERGIYAKLDANAEVDELFSMFRALVNTRQPEPAAQELLEAQDELLQALAVEKGVATLADATPSPLDARLLLWQGDITCLAADAIVNAANAQMLGCWVPGHHCIDNAIHTFAGIQLRLECARQMAEQGTDEATGAARITGAYNLPAKHIIHTVGPIAAGHPTARHRVQLASCYTSCLDCAEQAGVRSIAFCCISTGVFGFSQREAAQIAVKTVRAWLEQHDGGLDVVFNVFLDSDAAIYRELLALA